MAAKKAASKKAATKKGDEPVRMGRAKRQPVGYAKAYFAEQERLKKKPKDEMNALVKQAEKVFGKGNFKVYDGGIGIGANARDPYGPAGKTSVFKSPGKKTETKNYKGGSGPTSRKK